MKELKKNVEIEVLKACHKVYLELKTWDQIEITPSTQDKFGHYQCNSAMKLARILQKNPREIASSIANELQYSSLFSKVEVAGPGFINLTLSSEYLSQMLNQAILDLRLGIELSQKKQKIIVEYSSPNIAKEMHVGHLRSTIIGDCLARLFEFLGHDVLRLNHVGDWGTAFGMLIAFMKEEAPEVLSGKKETDLSSLMHWYKESKKRFDLDNSFKQRARKEVIELQQGSEESKKAWEIICKISRDAFQKIYDLLGISGLVERGESFYNPQLPEVVSDLEKKGLVTESEGAKCVFHEGFTIPLMVQKSDGGYNYDTTDVAAMIHRVRVEKADRIVIVTDAGQSLHFRLIYETCVKADYLEPSRVKFDHVIFGLVLGSDGKKFRTRSGDTEKLIDLLLAAIDEAKRLLKERTPEIQEQELNRLGRILGINAVKYADLSSHRQQDYIFSYERMLRFEGNTATFILYSFVRVEGIKRKLNLNTEVLEDIKKTSKISLAHPSEIQLAVCLLQFHDTLKSTEKDLFPHYLTDYLYELAQKFNLFFRDCRVEGTPEQNSRILICEVVSKTMEIGLQLLGLEIVHRM